MTIRITNTPDGFVENEALQAHMADTQQAPTGPSSRVINGALSVSAGRANVQEHSTAIHNHGFDHMGISGGSVMATRQRVNGADTVQLIPGVEGSRTHISQAVREGIVRQIGQGIYEDQRTDDGSQRVMQTEQLQASDDDGGAFNHDEAAAWGEVTAGISEGAVNAAVAGLANLMAQGGNLDRVAQRLARDTGLSPAEALQRIELAEQVQEAALARALWQAGIQGDNLTAFYAAARANPARLTDAVLHLVHGRDASRFVAWAREWSGGASRRAASSGSDSRSTQQPPVFDAATLQAAGFDTSTSRTGVLMIKPTGTNGRWVPAADLLATKA